MRWGLNQIAEALCPLRQQVRTRSCEECEDALRERKRLCLGGGEVAEPRWRQRRRGRSSQCMAQPPDLRPPQGTEWLCSALQSVCPEVECARATCGGDEISSCRRWRRKTLRPASNPPGTFSMPPAGRRCSRRGASHQRTRGLVRQQACVLRSWVLRSWVPQLAPPPPQVACGAAQAMGPALTGGEQLAQPAQGERPVLAPPLVAQGVEAPQWAVQVQAPSLAAQAPLGQALPLAVLQDAPLWPAAAQLQPPAAQGAQPWAAPAAPPDRQLAQRGPPLPPQELAAAAQPQPQPRATVPAPDLG